MAHFFGSYLYICKTNNPCHFLKLIMCVMALIFIGTGFLQENVNYIHQP